MKSQTKYISDSSTEETLPWLSGSDIADIMMQRSLIDDVFYRFNAVYKNIALDIESLLGEKYTFNVTGQLSDMLFPFKDLLGTFSQATGEMLTGVVNSAFNGISSQLLEGLADQSCLTQIEEHFKSVPFLRMEPSDQAFSQVAEEEFGLASDVSLCDAAIVDENILNQGRLRVLRAGFEQELLRLIHDYPFEYGIAHEADTFVREQLDKNAVATRDWLNRIFVENFENVSVLLGLLHVIARLDYDEIYPEGQTMAIAALSHKNNEVKECGVRAFESWEEEAGLKALENLHVGPGWLQDYIDEVILYLRSLYNVGVCQKDIQG